MLSQTHLSEIKKFLNLVSNGGTPILHIRNFFPNYEQRKSLKILSELEYTQHSAAERERGTTRHLVLGMTSDSHFLFSQYIAIAELIKKELHIKTKEYNYFAYKYSVGEAVREHRDKLEYPIAILAHFGAFTGGEFYYYGNDKKRQDLKVESGDIVIALNVNHTGDKIGLLHGVAPVLTGTRFTLALTVKI